MEIKIIQIFLASSSELKEDREQFEIFINRKNKEYIYKGIFLELIIWEDFIDAMSATRLQDEYNNAIKECDLFISLFATKVGQYTEEEFDTAFGTFTQNNTPLIYTYFKDSPINLSRITSEINTLLNFKAKLNKLGHFYTNYNNIEDLKFRFSEQLNKILNSLDLMNSFSKQLTFNTSLEQDKKSFKQEVEITQQELNQYQTEINQLQQKLNEKESIIIELQEKIQQLETSVEKNATQNIEIEAEIELKSEKGIDYTKLRNLLAGGKWKEANQETAKVMLQVANRESEGYLTVEDIDHFPSEDLRTIDQLWVYYSKGKFGFSVQKKIYVDQLGGKRNYNETIWFKFCDRIGWRKSGNYLRPLNNLNFDLEDTTPIGYYPFYMDISNSRIIEKGKSKSTGRECLIVLFSRKDL
ncbi:GUN4 domain-containing protein [Crocosphaera sp.]|uniref:GUN4 domain-containing protein n=1 Tax=Crocosphaera sp. TaxID=2729996 RepID=UPI003F248DCB|nr:GUN4 domain-containing protein [Crocosphaera sp.]